MVQRPTGGPVDSALQPPRQPAAPQAGLPIPRLFEVVGQLYTAGRLGEAARLCRQLISRAPNMADAHNVFGVISNALGEAEQATVLIQRAIELDPNVASYYANLGEVERQRGRLEEAEAALSKAIELEPGSAQAYSNLGIVHFDRKDFEAAAAAYERAIELEPVFPEAHNNLGNAYRTLERRKDALAAYQRAVTQREGYAEAYNNMASALQEGRDIESAEHAYRKAIGLKPGYVEAYNNLAGLLLRADRTEDALRALGDALKIDEKNVTTLLNISRTQLKRGAHVIAEQAAKMAAEIDPTKSEPHAVQAEIKHELDRAQEAVVHIDHAIELEPDGADLHSFRGVLLKSVGRLDEARIAVRRAIELNPKLYSAYSNLIDLETFETSHDLLSNMEAILAGAEDPLSERYLPLYFTMGKALEDAADYPRALEHYRIGAKLRREQLKYDEADTLDFFERIKAAFTKETFDQRRFEGNPSRVPVFIVGMPRSGSTLVEQILSSHPDTYGAGEIKVLHRCLGNLRDRFPMIPKYPMMVEAMEPSHFAQVAQSYLAEVERDAGGAKRVTDKLLTNFFFVGLIHLLFPNAKIIHTRRNPVDTCLSAYTKLFKDDMPHSYDFGELGRYYGGYRELMAHWEHVLPPGVMKTVDYESVIDDLEGNARTLVKHIGLPWNVACLDFHKSKRSVKTASVVQVRQPVYRTSVERWRRYGDGLAPLLASLNYTPPVQADEKPRRKPRAAANKV
jgi:tetratricopeptide (TPR) repeat protein